MSHQVPRVHNEVVPLNRLRTQDAVTHKEHPMAQKTTLGELISTLYDEFLAIYADEDLASVATAAAVNNMLVEGRALRAEARPPDHSASAA